jgi:energy-coupling factor transporter ATP-binding protein EcfA2
MDKLVVKKMDVDIELNGLITAVIGPTNSGKTTLLKKLCNKIDNSDLYIDDININEYDIDFLRNNLVCVLDDDIHYTDTVTDELFYHLNELGYSPSEITTKIKDILKYFKLEKIEHEYLDSLYMEDRMMIKILSYLIINPKIIAIDDLMSYLDDKRIDKLLDYIKEKGMSLIYVTTNTEFLLRADNVVVMNNFKSIMNSNVQSVLNGNSIMPYIGLKLPFVVDLSQNLILYDLLDKVMTDEGKLVSKIWK